jgi:hypothetical protein
MILCTFQILCSVARAQIVRARKHQGSSSLDLTVPSKVCGDYDVQQGDVFEVDALLDHGDVRLVYKRVYRKR